MKLGKQAMGLALATVLIAAVWPSYGRPASAAGITSYTGHYGDSASDKTAVLKPKWQAQTDYADGGSSHVAAADGRVYYSYKGKIIAANGPRNPISQLDLIGQGAFVGLTDGRFYIMNAATGKMAGKLITDARQFGATEVESGMAIVQAEHRIYAVALPSSLAK